MSNTTDQICVLTHSKHLSATYDHAQTARSSLLGRCEIAVIDSLSTSACLGYLVEAVAEAAKSGMTIDDIIHVARGTVHRLYSVYYVNTLDTIQQDGDFFNRNINIPPSQSIEGGG